MVAEPVIYLVVWSTIAEQSGGSVGGLTPGELRRVLHRLDARPEHEHRLHAVRLGVADPRGRALRPAASPAASDPLRPRVVRGLEGRRDRALAPDRRRPHAALRPDLRRASRRDRVFAVAIWGAYLIRSFNQSALGMVTFWTTRVGAIFSALHHGRAAALGPARAAARSCPTGCRRSRGSSRSGGRSTSRSRRSSVISPIRSCSSGSAMQVFWICVGIGIFSLVWRHAIRQYSAVGN